MTFYLATHERSWLARPGGPWLVSRRRLIRRLQLPRAIAPWALDSGGFTELSMHGRWTLSPRTYAAEARRYIQEIGSLTWAAPLDWMCEPAILTRTGRTVEHHQARTIASYLELCQIAPDVPWLPVLQGWTLPDYQRHADQYARAGVPLALLPIVAVGTLCRRQHTIGAAAILAAIAARGIRIHAFGLKVAGIRRAWPYLASADSLAWSYAARRSPPLPGCTHARCSNCHRFALAWRRQITDQL